MDHWSYDSHDERLSDLQELTATVRACTRLSRVTLIEYLDLSDAGDAPGQTTSQLTREMRRAVDATLRARGGGLQYELLHPETGDETSVEELGQQQIEY